MEGGAPRIELEARNPEARMRSKMMLLAMAGAFLAGIAVAKQPGPVIKNLGPVVPTPMPSPKHEEHIRLISSFTLNNKPDGQSIISFEATDFGVSQSGADKTYRTIATEQYSLAEPKEQARALRDEIVQKVRDLETDLLRFAEITGPPHVREPITSPGGAGAGGGGRPY
jgi:hypothetical protein